MAGFDTGVEEWFGGGWQTLPRVLLLLHLATAKLQV